MCTAPIILGSRQRNRVKQGRIRKVRAAEPILYARATRGLGRPSLDARHSFVLNELGPVGVRMIGGITEEGGVSHHHRRESLLPERPMIRPPDAGNHSPQGFPCGGILRLLPSDRLAPETDSRPAPLRAMRLLVIAGRCPGSARCSPCLWWTSLVAQRLDGVHLRRLVRGIQAEEDAHDQRK